MIIRCSECGVQYRIDKKRLSDQNRIFRCSQCGEILRQISPSDDSPKTPTESAAPTNKPRYLLIICPDCGAKYRLSTQRLKEGKSGLRCRNCDRIISLRHEQPARSLKVQVIRTDQPESQSQGSRQPVFQTYSGTKDSKKKKLVILASACTGLLVLIAAGIFFGYPLLLPKNQPQRSIREPSARSIQKPGSAAGQPFVLLEVDLPAFLRELKQRLPYAASDPRWRFVSVLGELSAVRRVFFLLYPDPQDRILPVLVLQGNKAADLKKVLLHNDPWQHLLVPAEGNAYRFHPKALGVAATSGFPAKSYRIWIHADWAVCAPQKQSPLWQDGMKQWHAYSVSRFAETVEKPIRLVGLAVRIPENLPTGWTHSLIPETVTRDDPQTRLAIDAAAPFLALLDRSIQQIVSMAGVFRFVGDDARSLQYAQQFRAGINGNDVFNRLQSGSLPGDRTSISAIISKLLHHDRLHTSVELHENRLTVDLQWQSDDDQALLQAVIEAVFGPRQFEETTRTP